MRVGCRREPPRPSLARRIRSESPPTTSRRTSLGSSEDEVVDDHSVLEIAKTVDQLRCVRAPTTDHGHLGPHAAQRNIRPCPRPLIPVPTVLAFDGGSTKTDVVLVARDGAVLGRARVGPEQPPACRPRRNDRGADRGRRRRRGRRRAVRGPLSTGGPTGVYCLGGIDLPGRRGEARTGDRGGARLDRSGSSCAMTRSPSLAPGRRRAGASASSAGRA